MMKKIQDAGFRIAEVPVHHYHRAYGKSQFFNFRAALQDRRRRAEAVVSRWSIRREHRRHAARRRRTAPPPAPRGPRVTVTPTASSTAAAA